MRINSASCGTFGEAPTTTAMRPCVRMAQVSQIRMAGLGGRGSGGLILSDKGRTGAEGDPSATIDIDIRTGSERMATTLAQ